MRVLRGSTWTWIAATVLMAGAGDAIRASAEAIFSISSNQYSGGSTLVQQGVYHSAGGVTPYAPPFVPPALGIDAIAADEPGSILFSVAQRGLVHHSGGMTMLEHDRVYRYWQATGAIEPVPCWNAWGVNIGTLDALDRGPDGRLVFSTSAYVWVTPPNGQRTLRPENAYSFDPATGAIELVLDGQALGLADLDGVDVLGNGRVAFSTATQVFLMTPSGGRLLAQNQIYVLNPNGEVALIVDTASRGIQTLDAFDVEALVVIFDQPDILWSGLSTSQLYDIVRGDLMTLGGSEGDFALATVECVANDVAGASFAYPVDPDPGQGFWLVVRPDQGSYDSGSFRQIASRDAGIEASGAGCP